MNRKSTLIKTVFTNMQRSVLCTISRQTGLGVTKPVLVLLDLTRGCNLRCSFCDIWSDKTGRNPTLKEIELILGRLKAWLGNFSLVLSGGEPFLRKDIAQILKITSAMEILTYFVSNGTIMNQALADTLVSSGVRGVSFSLDTLDADKHDEMRGVKGTSEKVMRSIEFLKKSKKRFGSEMRITIATVLSRKNLKDISALLDWVVESSLDGLWIQPINGNFSTKIEDDWYSKSDLWVRPEDMESLDRLIERLMRVKRSNDILINSTRHIKGFKTYFATKGFPYGSCEAGMLEIGIRVNGDIVLCTFMEPIGNILAEEAEQIWKGATAESRRKEIKACRKTCGIAFCFLGMTISDKVRKLKGIISG